MWCIAPMNYEKIDMGSYQLHIIKTNKFKTITVEVNFRREVKKEEITIRNLLKSVLLSTNQNFKSERELIKESKLCIAKTEAVLVSLYTKLILISPISGLSTTAESV